MASKSIFAVQKNGILRVLLLLGCLLTITSCFDEGDCLTTNTTLVKITLKSLATKADTTITFNSIVAVDGPDVYINKPLSKWELPVHPGETETTFILIRDTQKDTLTLHYRNETVVLAPSCGAFDFQKDLEATKNTVGKDSIRWINNQLFKSVTVNAYLYF